MRPLHDAVAAHSLRDYPIPFHILVVSLHEKPHLITYTFKPRVTTQRPSIVKSLFSSYLISGVRVPSPCNNLDYVPVHNDKKKANKRS